MKNVIWAGSLIDRKKPLLLLKCAKKFPELKFTMLGDGELEEEVRNYISKEKLANVEMVGRISNEDVYKYMKQSDLLLMTSEHEGLPKVIQEAAQCGVPTIYMANHYSVDFIQNGVNGFAVHSLEEMFEKIKYLQEEQKEYKEISQRIKETVSQYEWGKLILQYEEWFLDIFETYQIKIHKK